MTQTEDLSFIVTYIYNLQHILTRMLYDNENERTVTEVNRMIQTYYSVKEAVRKRVYIF